MENNKFKKEERLCNKRLINVLYESGSSFILYPYKVVFHPANELAFPAQVLIAVPKRRFKRAVDRNLLKRRIREVYRVNKQNLLYEFLNQQQVKVLFSIQYIGKEIHDFSFIELKLKEVLFKLQNEYAKLHFGKDN